MENIKLLDCTLRDGGYLNDWNYGKENMISMFNGLVDTKVDFIEVGFLDDRREKDLNRAINPNTKCYDEIYLGVEKGQSKVLAMIDYGTCDLSNLEPASNSFIDGIRVIYKMHLIHEALAFVKEVKKLGYIVFAQCVSITTYEDKDLLELTNIVNEVKPYALSMVDTYGLLNQDTLLRYVSYLDEHLNSSIALGFHSHNNLQLAYSNCFNFFKHKHSRTFLADGTLFGMGKSAGNCPLELLFHLVDTEYGCKYDETALYNVIDNEIPKYLNQGLKWGYQMHFSISGTTKTHPNYYTWLKKNTSLNLGQINEVLHMLSGPKALLYSQDYIKEIYDNYVKGIKNV